MQTHQIQGTLHVAVFNNLSAVGTLSPNLLLVSLYPPSLPPAIYPCPPPVPPQTIN